MSQPNPSAKCILQAAGYQAIFELLSRDQEGYVHYNLNFLLEPGLGAVALRSAATSIAVRDLESLLDYLEDHLSRVASNPSSEADVFIEYELGFQLQALSGDANEDGSDGGFTIRFLVNVGRDKEDENDDVSTNVYVGAESIISFSRVRYFVSSMRSALAELPNV